MVGILCYDACPTGYDMVLGAQMLCSARGRMGLVYVGCGCGTCGGSWGTLCGRERVGAVFGGVVRLPVPVQSNCGVVL